MAAGWMLGLGLLLGMAMGQGEAENRLTPQVEAMDATNGHLVHLLRQQECLSIAFSGNMGHALKVDMFGVEYAAWEPQWLTRTEQEGCRPRYEVREPLETHWGAMEAP